MDSETSIKIYNEASRVFRISKIERTCYVAVVIAKSGLLAVELLRNTVGVVYRTPVPRFTPPGPAARPWRAA